MLPYRHAADTLSRSNLIVAVPSGKTEVEDALLLFRQVTDHELYDI